MLLGTDIRAVLATLEALEVDVIGLNCSTGPEHMRDAVRYLVEYPRSPCTDSQCRAPDEGPTARRSFPRSPRRWPNGSRVRRALGVSSSAAAAAPRPTMSGDRRRVEPTPRPPPERPAAPSAMTRRPAPAGAATDADRRAPQLPGLAQGQELLLADDYDGLLVVARGPGRRRRPHARRVHGAHRAPTRPADAQAGQAVSLTHRRRS